jgi:NSS family neurotransmitter:Na+ symporter
MKGNNRASWSGTVAFILAASASAVGLGNLWRFPYLATKYGGGVFIAVYLIFALTFGVALLVTEIAIGRYSRQSQLTAFKSLGYKNWSFLGILATIVPLVILPYYNVISGWVLRFFVEYVQLAFTGGTFPEPDTFFKNFVSEPTSPFVYMVCLTVFSSIVILIGVKNGIEKANLIMMPMLFVIAVALAVYVAFLPGAMEGIKFYLIPDFSKCDNLGKVVLGAMGQMFYSLSLAMGIMITYGSYMKRTNSITKSAYMIAIADVFVATIAGFMIVPIVVMYAAKANGSGALTAGPGLMFETLPKIFLSFGAAGTWIGLVFFTLVLFAALTSTISMTETCVASVCDFFKISRVKSTASVCVWTILLGSLSAFGYGRWKNLTFFDLPALDFFDSSMNILTPLIAALTCFFVGWVMKPKRILAECRKGGSLSSFKIFYVVMVKFIAPIFILAILISEALRLFCPNIWNI